MKKSIGKSLVAIVAVIGMTGATLLLEGCASGGSSRVRYGVGVGYGGYYGGGPWGGYSRYPVYVGGGGGGYPDIDDGPSAVQLPEFGMPGGGGLDAMPMDMGGFDF